MSFLVVSVWFHCEHLHRHLLVRKRRTPREVLLVGLCTLDWNWGCSLPWKSWQGPECPDYPLMEQQRQRLAVTEQQLVVHIFSSDNHPRCTSINGSPKRGSSSSNMEVLSFL